MVARTAVRRVRVVVRVCEFLFFKPIDVLLCAYFLVAVLFDVAVAAGKVTSTKAVVFSPASNIAKPETPFERSPPPPSLKWADFEKRRQNPV